MTHRYRGIVVAVVEGCSVAVLGDRGVRNFLCPDHSARVGDWVDVAGGGFMGLYDVRPLAVFA